MPERRRLVGLQQERAGAAHGQHDLRRHHFAGDRRRQGAAERRPGRRATASNAASPTSRRRPTASSGPSSGWGSHYSVSHNPGAGGTWTLYYLYGLERAGRLTARRFLPLPPGPASPAGPTGIAKGPTTWSATRTACRASGRARAWARTNPLIGTSFALLFLSKGRWPVLLGKLQHGGGDDWNRHRSDVANLTRYVETRWKRDLTWQVIDLRLASVDDLIQTPVLYLCGSQSPLPDEPAERKELAQKLRDYLDRGGFLLAEADCGGAGFDRGFRDLMREVFPEPEYKLQLLEPEHPIWYAEEKIDPRQLRPLWGIEFGCRTSVVYAPPDPPADPRPSLSCLWELSRPGRGVKYSPAVQAQIDAALSLGINVLAYATNRELKTKEDFFRPTDRAAAGRSGRARPARRRHPPPSRRLQRRAPGAGEPDGRRRPRAESPHARPPGTARHHRSAPCSTITWSSCTAGPPSA